MNFKRMKTLLLELAIHGKLVPQMTEEGQVKSSIDGPFELPKTWGWRKFEDVLFFENGDRGSNYPAKSTLTRDPSSGHPFVSAINLNNGRICPDDLLYLSVEQKQKLRSGHIKAGDCLFCIRGSLGKFGFAEADGGAIASSLVILRKKDAATIREEFLAYVLQSPFFAQCIEDRSNGTAQPNLGAKELKGFPFPVPPLQEQARIVAKLEEAFAEIDRAEKAYEELQTLAGVLRGQILQEAIQGKLVPQLAEEGVVEQIGVVPKDVPFEIPESWKWCHMEGITHRIHYGFTASATNTGTAKLLRITDIQDGRVNWETVPFCKVPEKKLASSRLKENDVVIARTGGTIGKSFLLTGVSDVAVFASYLIRLIPNVEVIDPRYLMVFLNSPDYWKQLKAMSRGTGQPNVNAKSLSTLLVPLPSLAEQKRIVTTVEELLKQVDALSAR